MSLALVRRAQRMGALRPRSQAPCQFSGAL